MNGLARQIVASRARRPGRLRAAAGFTMIELLVVVAIIALLVGILLPTVGRCRELSRRAVCLTNLKHIGTAAMSYAADSNMHIPRGCDLDNDDPAALETFTDNCLWFKVFLPHLGRDVTTSDYREVAVYQCPSFPDKYQCICYVNNSWTFSGRDDGQGVEIMAPTRIDRFDKSGQTVYLADNEDASWRPIITDDASEGCDRLTVWEATHLSSDESQMTDDEKILDARRVARDRHAGGCNVMYVNGAAAWVGADEMSVDMWRDNWR